MAVVWLNRRLAQGRVSMSADPPETQAAIAWRQSRHRPVAIAGQTGHVHPGRHLAPIGDQRTVRRPPQWHRHGGPRSPRRPERARARCRPNGRRDPPETTLLVGTAILQVRFGGRGERSNEPFCYRSIVGVADLSPERRPRSAPWPGCDVTVVQPARGGRRRLYARRPWAEARRRRLVDSPDPEPGDLLGPPWTASLPSLTTCAATRPASFDRSGSPGDGDCQDSGRGDGRRARRRAGRSQGRRGGGGQRRAPDGRTGCTGRTNGPPTRPNSRSSGRAVGGARRAASTHDRPRWRPAPRIEPLSTSATSRLPERGRPRAGGHPAAGRARPGSHRGLDRPGPGRGFRPPSLWRRGCGPSGGRPFR